MAKHTKGPWTINYDKDDGCPLEIVAATHDHRVALLASNGTRADAVLLAASPYLLAALRRCLNYIENTENELGITLGCGDAAREALAKVNP